MNDFGIVQVIESYLFFARTKFKVKNGLCVPYYGDQIKASELLASRTYTTHSNCEIS